jgi:indolepyruvate decarboxylase
VSADVKPILPRSNQKALQKAMTIIAKRINNAKSMVAFPAFTISRLGLQKQAQKTIEALGCPFVTTLMEKCAIDEGHPIREPDAARGYEHTDGRRLVRTMDAIERVA